MAPAHTAWGQSATPDDGQVPHRHRHAHGRHDLVALANQLGSLTDPQRDTLKQIAATQRTASAPVRQADAAVLDLLARQIEAGAIDRAALDGSLQARASAMPAARTAHQDAIQSLHDALTPDQRNQLVDAAEADAPHQFGRGGQGGGPGHAGGPLAAFGRHLGLTDAQKDQIRANFRAAREAEGGSPPAHRHPGGGPFAGKAWLESFRSDGFQASANASDAGAAFLAKRESRLEDWMQAAVPVLTQSQRATLADHLRRRATRERSST